MEDFLVLSILDLQLDANLHHEVRKDQVIVYVMLGDTCVDCLILGSPNSTIQDRKKSPQRDQIHQQADSGGAAAVNRRVNFEDDERGSVIEDIKVKRHDDEAPIIIPAANYHKKTKVPLAGISYGPNQKRDPKAATLQLVVRHIGTQKERFGSVSFSLQRFTKATGHSYMHWVTLYDQLDDDLFEGELGEDEDQDFPRILIDYQIISSKFTSMINRTEDLQLRALEARENFERDNT